MSEKERFAFVFDRYSYLVRVCQRLDSPYAHFLRVKKKAFIDREIKKTLVHNEFIGALVFNGLPARVISEISSGSRSQPVGDTDMKEEEEQQQQQQLPTNDILRESGWFQYAWLGRKPTKAISRCVEHDNAVRLVRTSMEATQSNAPEEEKPGDAEDADPDEARDSKDEEGEEQEQEEKGGKKRKRDKRLSKPEKELLVLMELSERFLEDGQIKWKHVESEWLIRKANPSILVRKVKTLQRARLRILEEEKKKKENDATLLLAPSNYCNDNTIPIIDDVQVNHEQVLASDDMLADQPGSSCSPFLQHEEDMHSSLAPDEKVISSSSISVVHPDTYQDEDPIAPVLPPPHLPSSEQNLTTIQFGLFSVTVDNSINPRTLTLLEPPGNTTGERKKRFTKDEETLLWHCYRKLENRRNKKGFWNDVEREYVKLAKRCRHANPHLTLYHRNFKQLRLRYVELTRSKRSQRNEPS